MGNTLSNVCYPPGIQINSPLARGIYSNMYYHRSNPCAASMIASLGVIWS